jgi:hypothetical protein
LKKAIRWCAFGRCASRDQPGLCVPLLTNVSVGGPGGAGQRASMEQPPNSSLWPARPLTLSAHAGRLSFPQNRQRGQPNGGRCRSVCIVYYISPRDSGLRNEPHRDTGWPGSHSLFLTERVDSCSRVAADLWPRCTSPRGTGDGIRRACEEAGATTTCSRFSPGVRAVRERKRAPPTWHGSSMAAGSVAECWAGEKLLSWKIVIRCRTAGQSDR